MLEWYRARSRQLGSAEGGSVALERLQLVEANLDDESTGPGDREDLLGLYRRALNIVRDEFQERTWKAFVGRVLEGRSTADVASDLGLTPDAVRMAKMRVLNRIRHELREPL